MPNVEADIRLGDVVVCSSYKQFVRVVQYDLGKATTGGFEQRGGFHEQYARILLNAASNVPAQPMGGKSRLLENLSKLTYLPVFARENAGPDVLFTAVCMIIGRSCVWAMQYERQSRSQEIVVHYGTVVSGNQVVRDGATRDGISLRLGGVLCIEMEAASLMDSFDVSSLRGICDYVDSHKNKRVATRCGRNGSGLCEGSAGGDVSS